MINLDPVNDRPPRGTGHTVAGWFLLAFVFLYMVVNLTISHDNTQTWEGLVIPNDLTPAETLGEITYQIWYATGCLVGGLVALALIIIGTIRRQG